MVMVMSLGLGDGCRLYVARLVMEVENGRLCAFYCCGLVREGGQEAGVRRGGW
jgi:hypothetical protein